MASRGDAEVVMPGGRRSTTVTVPLELLPRFSIAIRYMSLPGPSLVWKAVGRDSETTCQIGAAVAGAANARASSIETESAFSAAFKPLRGPLVCAAATPRPARDSPGPSAARTRAAASPLVFPLSLIRFDRSSPLRGFPLPLSVWAGHTISVISRMCVGCSDALNGPRPPRSRAAARPSAIDRRDPVPLLARAQSTEHLEVKKAGATKIVAPACCLSELTSRAERWLIPVAERFV